MKAETITPEDIFKPVTLNLTFESQEEMDVFYQIFNWVPITDAQEKVLDQSYDNSMHTKIRDALGKHVINGGPGKLVQLLQSNVKKHYERS